MINIFKKSQRRLLRKRMLHDLRAYGGCAVCGHCDRGKYPGYNYCEFGGCNGGGNGKIKEDRWEYRGSAL